MDAIHASGGRCLTRARATSVIVEDGRAAGVTVVREVPGTPAAAAAAAAATAAGVKVMVTGDGSGSVISSVGIIDSFRGLVPPSPDATAGAGAGAGAKPEAAAVAETAKALGEKEGDGLDPAGFRILRAARPRVHLCVGLQGNWLEDLDGTSSYVHHVSVFVFVALLLNCVCILPLSEKGWMGAMGRWLCFVGRQRPAVGWCA